MADIKRMVPLLDALQGLIKSKVELETKIGIVRRGTLTGLRKRELRVGGSIALVPEMIVLDADDGDPIAVSEIVRIGRFE